MSETGIECKYNCIKYKYKCKCKSAIHVIKKKVSSVCLHIYVCIFCCTHTLMYLCNAFHLKTPKCFGKLSIVLCCSPFTDGDVKVQRGYMCKAHCFLGCNYQQMSSQLAEELPLPPSASHLLLLNGELAILVQAFRLPIPAASFHSTWRKWKPQRSFDMFQSSPFFKKTSLTSYCTHHSFPGSGPKSCFSPMQHLIPFLNLFFIHK